MNSCEEIRHQLNELLDNELLLEDEVRVNAHLDHCKNCQTEWQSLQELDSQLAGALTIPNLHQNIEAIRNATEVAPQASSWKNIQWIVTVTAIAASIALICFSIARNERKPGPQPVVARMVSATGPIQVCEPDSGDWRTVDPAERCDLVAGAKIRTGAEVLCEFETADSGKFRMNESAELWVADPAQIQLQNGQLWLESPKASSLQVDAVFQNQSIAIFGCPSDSQFQCVAEPDKATCSSLSPTNGVASCTIGTFECPVDPGQTIVVDPGPTQQTVDRDADAMAKSKVWQLPLLALNATAGGELYSALRHVLAPIGMTKARHLNEQQIRRLGPSGAVPLLIFATDSLATDQPELRRTAVRLGSELADAKAIGMLRKLADDPDRSVASYAKLALDRITQTENSSL